MTGDADDHDLAEDVETFLRDARRVYEEYDRGYVDADVALTRLRAMVDDLRGAVEGADADAGDGD